MTTNNVIDISKPLGDVEVLIDEIWDIKNSPEGQQILGRIKSKKAQVGKIFQEFPRVKSIYRFRRLMEFIDEAEHFGHYGRAIARAEYIGRIKKATTEETAKIIECLKEKKQLPFLTVGYKKVWYVLIQTNKSDQALMLNLRNLYYRAKKARES